MRTNLFFLIISVSVLSIFMSNFCSDKTSVKKSRNNALLAQSLPDMNSEPMTKEIVFNLAKWKKKITNATTIGEMKEIWCTMNNRKTDLKKVVMVPEPNKYGVMFLKDHLSVAQLIDRGIEVVSVHIVDCVQS